MMLRGNLDYKSSAHKDETHPLRFLLLQTRFCHLFPTCLARGLPFSDFIRIIVLLS